MDHKKKKILSLLVSLVLLFILYVSYDHLTYIKTDNAQIFGHSLMLAPKVSGYITKINVTEGQKVKAKDILLEIDSRDFENNLKMAKDELTSIMAKQRSVSRAQYSDSAFAAKYEAIAAQVSQAELDLSSTKISAPNDGFIAKRSAEIGQLATAGIPLFGFVDSNERWIIANFKETDIENIKINAKVEIEVDAISSKSFTGSVESISSATGATFTLLPPDNATGNFTKVVQRVPVKIKIENLSAEDVNNLKTGLSALVKVHKH